ncbi:hypothetical protein LCGC14_2545850 [marine sediment metagenome]|uniref:Uncharacterized protein n=1 Tax=marine sediment metagenome TaxID=412755 RepID=A0A0F9BC48_9ZZZZ
MKGPPAPRVSPDVCTVCGKSIPFEDLGEVAYIIQMEETPYEYEATVCEPC